MPDILSVKYILCQALLGTRDTVQSTKSAFTGCRDLWACSFLPIGILLVEDKQTTTTKPLRLVIYIVCSKMIHAKTTKSKPGQEGSEMCVGSGWGQLQITTLSGVLREGLTELGTF